MALNDSPSQTYTRPTFSESQEDDSRQAEPDARLAPRNSVLLGESAAARRLRSQVERISPYFRTALIRGEVGTGKQRVARAMHSLSPGKDGPFVVMSAAAVAESANAEEALGLNPAALLEPARGGTLFLEGVGELPTALQAGLLRFLRACEEGRAAVPQTGRPDSARLDTRILASSRRDVRTLSSMGQFRQDLSASLSAVEIFVPPVSRRVEDIPTLCDGILDQIAAETGGRRKTLSEAAMSQMQNRSWLGNLRELEQLVTRAATLAEGAVIEPRHMLDTAEATPMGSGEVAPRADRLNDVIHRHVLDVLTRCGGNKLRAAELLGISRSTLYRMLDSGSVELPK